MKKLFTFVILSCIATWMSATPRTVEEARLEANSFFHATASPGAKHAAANASFSLAHVVPQRTTDTPAAYVFQNGADNGFVIVSADDASTSILGYSDHGRFDADNIPANLQIWLQHYAEEIEWAAQQPKKPISRLAKANVSQSTGTAVAPLLDGIQWGQGRPFYNSCPFDSDSKRSVTGCVATAASQVMAYWQYPTQGIGSHSYTWKRSDGSTRTLSADFGATTYDWDNMLPSYNGSYTSTQANAVATLMFHAGVACDMDYTSDNSGAYTPDMLIALQTYFGYDQAMASYNADYEGYDVLAEKIQEELEANRPVMMGGATTQNEGHCFVCEGSDGNGNFYINWGWDGDCDGYYPLTALQPASQGTGGAASGLAFTVRVTAYTGIQPNQGGAPTPGRVGADSVYMNNSNVITKTTPIEFSIVQLTSINLTTWNGDLALAIYDAEGNYVDKILGTYALNIPSGYFYNVDIPVSGYLPSLADGQYMIVPAYTITGTNDVHPMPVKSSIKSFPFTVSGNTIDFTSGSTDQQAQYTIVFKDSDTGSDSGSQLTTTNATVNSFIQHSDISISSFASGYIYLARDNYGLKFGSSSKDGFLTLNLGQEIIVDSINIEIGGYNDTERNFILQGTTLTNINKASTGFETRTVKLGGARLNTISLQSTKRAYVKSLTIYTTDQETTQASFDFTYGMAQDYTNLGFGTNITLYLLTEDCQLSQDGYATSGTCLALDLGTASPYSMVGTYERGWSTSYTPGLLNGTYSYLSYGGDAYAIRSGVVTIINNSSNQFEFLYDLQVADGKSYTGTITLPISDVDLYSNTGYLTWQFEPIAAWDVAHANTEIATLSPNSPTIQTYLVEGIISQLNAVASGTNVAQFYISQDGTTNQQIYCYNARYLNNAVFTGGELAQGDTVVMFAKLEKYNGQNELLGYVFQHRPYVNLSLHTPYNLVAEPGLGYIDLSWECEGADQYEVEITELSDAQTWSFTTEDKFLSLNYSGSADEFAWRVRSLDQDGAPLSEWVDGDNFTTLDNPYQPTNLQVTTTDSHHYMFTWTADSIADLYAVVITLGDDVYAQLTVSEPVATIDITLSATYGWIVYALDADYNQVGYANGEYFVVNDTTDYSIHNLTAIANGLTISATWDSPAPNFDVRVLDANAEQIGSQIVSDNSIQYTVPSTGTYYVFVRPANAEYTYYLSDWEDTSVTVNTTTSSTQTYQLTLRAMNGGTVNTSASGTYTYGSTVDIVATANPGYRFLQWSDGNTNARRSVVVTRNMTLTAYFYEIDTHTLTINQAVGGHVSLPAGEYIYASGAMEMIFAIADEGYEFVYWQIAGQVVPDASNPLVLTMTSDITVTPIFISNEGTGITDTAVTTQPLPAKRWMKDQIVVVHGERIYNMLGQTIQ